MKTILYETPEADEVLGFFEYSYLRNRRSMYANGYLFFVECEESRDLDTYKNYYNYKTKYINLETGDVEILANGESYSDIIKLENGSVFIGFNILNPNEGVIFNPYTQDKYEGEDVVLDWELEGAIYKN